ncbi:MULTISPECIES: hypothetical protein [unclassified Bradyrhizobium]|uniref:hypothetical protein n=1 Tax=unclassified Bradyrhizobium TaxID=2631580 RepID=UPI0004B10E5E|nr:MULTISPECIES: hypothetical protein [Bradyrhizobium]UFW43076.1 hypothetical protein BcanWSM471_08210 [Bradyrhizobium canariense]
MQDVLRREGKAAEAALVIGNSTSKTKEIWSSTPQDQPANEMANVLDVSGAVAAGVALAAYCA